MTRTIHHGDFFRDVINVEPDMAGVYPAFEVSLTKKDLEGLKEIVYQFGLSKEQLTVNLIRNMIERYQNEYKPYAVDQKETAPVPPWQHPAPGKG